MNITDCGWKEESRQLIPVMKEKNTAPDELLKVIHCNYLAGYTPLAAAADVMDFLVPQHVVHAN